MTGEHLYIYGKYKIIHMSTHGTLVHCTLYLALYLVPCSVHHNYIIRNCEENVGAELSTGRERTKLPPNTTENVGEKPFDDLEGFEGWRP